MTKTNLTVYKVFSATMFANLVTDGALGITDGHLAWIFLPLAMINAFFFFGSLDVLRKAKALS